MLSGLEAIHRNSVQGTAHETLTLGCSAHEAPYAAILRDDITEAMTHRLRSEADAIWKKIHEVMYNQQLEYNRQLSDFLKDAGQHKGPNLDSCPRPRGKRGHDL